MSFATTPSKNWNPIKFGRRFNSHQKKGGGGFTLGNYDLFFKNCPKKTKPVVRGYVYYEYVRYE